MKRMDKIVILLFVASAVLVSGCSKTKEIKLSEDVKKEVLLKAEDNKIRNKPVLKKKINGLENQEILLWIDDENILIANREASRLVDANVILYRYNLESGESTEILNDSNITRIYDYQYNRSDGLILVGNKKQAFVYDSKERKLEEVLDLDKEFENGIPGSKKPKQQQDLRAYNVKLIKQDYISYVSKFDKYDKHGFPDTADYTILNYKNYKKYTINERYYAAGIDCEFDLTGKNIYIGQFAKLTKLNLETEEKTSMELSRPSIKNIFDDGTLFVDCIEDNVLRLYKVDFDKKVVSRYEKNYEGKKLSIDEVDFKNEFVCYNYSEDGEDRKQNIAMYGKLQGNKFVVTDKLFKNDEEADCNDIKRFIFSPNHNKFITRVTNSKIENKNDKEYEVNYLKDDKYLFELE